MKMKRLISFALVLTLLCAMLPTISLATDPAKDYKTVSSTTLYSGQGTGNLATVPKGKRVEGVLSGNSGWSFSSSKYSQVNYSTYTGYIRNSMIIPLNKSYVVSSTNAFITDATGATTGLAKGTYMCLISYSGTTYTMRAYLSSGYVVGTIPSSKVSIDYGY